MNRSGFFILFTIWMLNSPIRTGASESAASTENQQPRMVFQNTVFDAGLVNPGTKVTGVFVIENKGTADLVLQRVAPT